MDSHHWTLFIVAVSIDARSRENEEKGRSFFSQSYESKARFRSHSKQRLSISARIANL